MCFIDFRVIVFVNSSKPENKKPSNLILVKSSDLSVNQSGISRTIRTSFFR